MVLYRACKLTILTLLLSSVFFGCSKEEANVRKHVSINETSPEHIKNVDSKTSILEALVSEKKYEEALGFILSDNSLEDGELLGSKFLLDNFQKIIDKGFTAANQERLVVAANTHCPASFANCFISYFSNLDNRVLSHLIKSYSLLDRKLAFLNYILSSKYNGIEKWELVVQALDENKNVSRAHEEIFLTVLEQNSSYFRDIEGIEKLIGKYYPKKESSWYDYIVSLKDLGILSTELELDIVSKANADQVSRICSIYSVKKLNVSSLKGFDCEKTESSLEAVLMQDLALGVFPSNQPPKGSIDFDLISNVLLYRGFSLSERSLEEFNTYVSDQVKAGRVSSKFIQIFRQSKLPALTADWSSYFNDIGKIGELLAVYGDQEKMRGLAREYKNFFKIAVELPYNLILSSQILDLGHKETIDIDSGTVVIDSSTIAKQLFSGRMDQMITLIEAPERRSVLMNPLKVNMAFKAIQEFDIGAIFNKSAEDIVRVLFGQAVEEDYLRFDDIYQKYIRNRERISDFKTGCDQIERGEMQFNFNLNNILKSKRLILGPGSINDDLPLNFAKSFRDIYISSNASYFVPEMLEIYRSEFFPKSIIRDNILGKSAQPHNMEKAVAELISFTKEDLSLFNTCFFKMREVESSIASVVVKKEIEFADEVNEELEKLNSGELSESVLLEKYFASVKGITQWADFFEDLPVKYGFIKTSSGKYFFVDSPITQALRIAYYLKTSSFAANYRFDYSNYRTLTGKLEDTSDTRFKNVLSFKGNANPREFFLNSLENNFKLLDLRESDIFTLRRVNHIDAAIQKVEFNASEEEMFETFKIAADRSNDYVKYYTLKDWERSMLEFYPRNCPSCGFTSGDRLAGPYGFLASSTLPGIIINDDFIWMPLDNYFYFLSAPHIGFDAQFRDYLPLTNGVIIKGPRKASGSQDPRGDSVVDVEAFFNRESQWATIERITYTEVEVRWDSVIDFGRDQFANTVSVVKHDIKLLEALRKFSETHSSAYEFRDYNFSISHSPKTPRKFVSDHLWTSYDSDMREFHRDSSQLLK